MERALELDKAGDCREVTAGLALVRGVEVRPSPPELRQAIAGAVQVARAASEADFDAVRSAVRGMLRHGRYKPTGRAKPASEYLLGAAREDRFPIINNLVDVNNLISLRFLLPISIVDLSRCAALEPATEEPSFSLRRGHAGESYVFNDAGQSIELTDLLLVARQTGDVACANPVKDSMSTKVRQETRDALGIIYAPAALATRLADALQAFGDALRTWSGAREVATRIV